jgi:hypothetical protein
MLEFSPGYTQEGLNDMLAILHGLNYTTYQVNWDLTKMASSVDKIDAASVLTHLEDISTPELRKQLIERILPQWNTNLWFSR